jgi:hypothetical protein
LKRRPAAASDSAEHAKPHVAALDVACGEQLIASHCRMNWRVLAILLDQRVGCPPDVAVVDQNISPERQYGPKGTTLARALANHRPRKQSATGLQAIQAAARLLLVRLSDRAAFALDLPIVELVYLHDQTEHRTYHSTNCDPDWPARKA